MSALLKFGAQQEDQGDQVGTPNPEPGTLYEKHKGPRKYEGAGGNLKGGVTYDLPWGAVLRYLKNRNEGPTRDTSKFNNYSDNERKHGIPGAFDTLKWFIKYIGRWPSIDEVSKIYDTMLTARPEQLGDVLVNAGLARQDRKYDRTARNERNDTGVRDYAASMLNDIKKQRGDAPVWDVEKNPYLEPGTRRDGKYQRGKGYLIGSPHWNPNSNEVNWTPRYAMIHELGHAVDYNSSILGNEYMDPDSTKAKLRAALRSAYGHRLGVGRAIGTLNIEHKGWSKGFDAYLEGAAMQGKKWDEIKHIIREAAEAKNPALGSYWKHHGGDAAGNVLGLGAAGGVYKYLKPELGKSLKARGMRGALGGLIGLITSYGTSPLLKTVSQPLIDSIIESRGTTSAINEQVQDLKEDFDDKRREHA
jgi:hypothetical protein